MIRANTHGRRSRENFHRMIGRALTDPRFRGSLLSSPTEAAMEFEFSDEERAMIASVAAHSLEEFALSLTEQLEGRREPADQVGR